MSDTKTQWAVRWQDGEVEHVVDKPHAEQIVRLYPDAALISRTVTYGLWSDDDLAKRLVAEYVNEYGSGKLQAIRAYREQTRCSLLEARDAIYGAAGVA